MTESDVRASEPLQIQFSVAPYWIDTADTADCTAFFGHTTRDALVNVHYGIGFFNLQGHLWHALRAMGFDFKKIPEGISKVADLCSKVAKPPVFGYIT